MKVASNCARSSLFPGLVTNLLTSWGSKEKRESSRSLETMGNESRVFCDLFGSNNKQSSESDASD